MEIIEKYGSDALRFYLLSNPIMTAEDLKFSEKGVEDVHKKVILILTNALNFYILNSSGKEADLKNKTLLDEWILSRLAETGYEINNFMNKYDTISTAKEITKFVDDLSTWYVRRSRERFNDGDADVARTVLKTVLHDFSIILAPMLPFISEKIYLTIQGKKESVHLEEWLSFSKKEINLEIQEKMINVRRVASEALMLRDKEKIAVRQPLQSITSNFKFDDECKEIIMEELNVKKVIFDSKIKELILDTKLTPELEAEGFAREIARKIQAERKARNMKKEQRIELKLFVSDKLHNMIVTYEEFICKRVGSKKIKFVDEKNKNLVLFEIKEEKIGFHF